MSKETLEIIRGLSQAAANAYDGGHLENYSLDGQVRTTGLVLNEKKEFLCLTSAALTGSKLSFMAIQ
jgi:hypothetical protein